MNIKVCVGSSCHLKGSYDVIESFKEILKKYDVEDLITLQASFCMNACLKGVSVKADGMDAPIVEKTGKEEIMLHNVNKDNVEELCVKEIYPLLNI